MTSCKDLFAYEASGNHEKALILAKALLKGAHGPIDATTRYRVLEVAVRSGCACQQPVFAGKCLKELQARFPGSVTLRRLEGILLETRGDLGAADIIYSSLLETDPTDTFCLKRQIVIREATNQAAKALELLVAYVAIFQADHEAWLHLSQLYAKFGQFKLAIHAHEEVLLAHPRDPAMLIRMAELCYSDANFRNAEKYFSAALELETDFGDFSLNRAKLGLIAAAARREKGNQELAAVLEREVLEEYRRTEAKVMLPVIEEAIRQIKRK